MCSGHIRLLVVSCTQMKSNHRIHSYPKANCNRIDEILNAKGEERRRIFEEATGIVKYKARKAEAVSKLEKEQQNLLRAEDIIAEAKARADEEKRLAV